MHSLSIFFRDYFRQTFFACMIITSFAFGQERSGSAVEPIADVALVHGGSYVPFSKEEGATTRVRVNSFYIGLRPVTNSEFLKFVEANPRWRRSQVKQIFADKNYLRNWSGDLLLGANAKRSAPVTFVSWFAARAYCKWIGGRLPTTDEWEYAAARSHNIVKMSGPNKVIWEWTEDFDSVLLNGTPTDDGNSPSILSCGGSSVDFSDPSNYSAFLRFAFRSSLKANYSLPNLGFRCARSLSARVKPRSSVEASLTNVNLLKSAVKKQALRKLDKKGFNK